MSDVIIAWILKCWSEAKAEYEKEFETKQLKILAKSLRLFVNSVNAKSGIPPEHKTRAAEMAQYVENAVTQIPWDEKGVAHAIALSVQYARKHLGNTAIQGSAVKGKLSRSDRARVRKLVSNKPAPRPLEQKLSKNHVDGDDLQSGGLGNGYAQMD